VLLQGPGQNLTFERSADTISPSYSKICFVAVEVAVVIAGWVGWLGWLAGFWLAGFWLAGFWLDWVLAGWVLAGWVLAGLGFGWLGFGWQAINIPACLINFYRVGVFLEHIYKAL
jgi:hypothetical protein